MIARLVWCVASSVEGMASATPPRAFVVDFSTSPTDSIRSPADNGDDWYLEVLVDEHARPRCVGWFPVLPDYVAKRGGRYGFVTSTEKNARLSEWRSELLDRVDVHMREETCPIWAFQLGVQSF